MDQILHPWTSLDIIRWGPIDLPDRLHQVEGEAMEPISVPTPVTAEAARPAK